MTDVDPGAHPPADERVGEVRAAEAQAWVDTEFDMEGRWQLPYTYPDLEMHVTEAFLQPGGTSLTIDAIGKLAHASILKGHIIGHEGWLQAAYTYATGRYFDPETAGTAQATHADLAAMEFDLCIAGNMLGHSSPDALYRLGLLMETDHDGRCLKEIMRHAARAGISPGTWIEQFAYDPTAGASTVNPTRRAQAWREYVKYAQDLPQDRGLPVAEVAWRQDPSFLRVRQDLIDRRLDPSIVAETASLLLRAGQTPEDKMAIFPALWRSWRGARTAEEIGAQTLPTDVWALTTFGVGVLEDPALSLEFKRHVVDTIAEERDKWSTVRPMHLPDIAVFDLSRYALNGATPDEVNNNLNRIAVQAARGEEGRVTAYVLPRLARTYSARGRFDEASDIIARMEQTSRWAREIEAFVRNGGDARLVLDKDIYVQAYGPDGVQARERTALGTIANVLASPAADEASLSRAAEVLVGLAGELAGEPRMDLAQIHDPKPRFDFQTSKYVTGAVRALSSKNPALGNEVAAKIIDTWSRKGDFSSAQQHDLIVSMLHHGAPGAIETYWKFVYSHYPDPATFLGYYASVMLADTQLQVAGAPHG